MLNDERKKLRKNSAHKKKIESDVEDIYILFMGRLRELRNLVLVPRSATCFLGCLAYTDDFLLIFLGFKEAVCHHVILQNVH